jgi:O-antigen ligase
LLFGGKALRRTSITMSVILVVALIVRPGVRETLSDMLDSIFVLDGEQDASAEYRKLLWEVAWTKITVSPVKFLFGLGGGSTMLMDISGFFEAQRGGQVMEQGFSSWDNQWAANLVQFGIVGFVAETIFWLRALIMMTLVWHRGKNNDRDLLLFAVLVGCAVYLWAMLTVAMFSPQLRYLAAIFLACGVLLARSEPTEEVTETESTTE